MRFMYLVKGEQAGPPPQRLMDELGKLAEQAKRSGAMIDSGGLTPLTRGARVRLAGGNLTIVDGPFAESKEVIGGYAIFEFKSRGEALASAVEFMTIHRDFGEGWEGECEMRQVWTAEGH
jgi:hypothetical protein